MWLAPTRIPARPVSVISIFVKIQGFYRIFLFVSILDTPAPTSVSDHNKQVAENRLSSQIFAIIDHFHQEDPLGLPGAPVN